MCNLELSLNDDDMYQKCVLGKDSANCFTKAFQAKCILLKKNMPPRIFDPHYHTVSFDWFLSGLE